MSWPYDPNRLLWPRVPSRPWDEGVRWRIDEVTPPTEQTLEVAFVRDKFLRLTNGGAEDFYLERVIRVSNRIAENTTERAHMPQTKAWIADGFPRWEIALDHPPLLEVLSVEYLDGDGVQQTLDSAAYQVSNPRGPKAKRGLVAPVSGGSWPSIQSGTYEAVTVTFRCGYEDTSSPPVANVPEDIVHAQLLLVGEMFKQRSESIIGFGATVNPALVRARDIFMQYKAY